MSDKEQVHKAGIGSAIIVDDGYDETPTVAELRDEGAWDSLFDDAQGAEAERIEDVFSAYNPKDRELLRSNPKFIDALWQNRETLNDLLGGLFDDYEQKILDNRPFLDAAEQALTALDIPFEKCGRNFVCAAVDADLIVIDLFLGIQQGTPDRELTVERLKEAIEKRGEDRPPPSIVLMSQVPSIDDLAKDFRRDVKLHASAFRHIKKNDLQKPGRLEGLILTLATHRSDSQALAKFVGTWEDNAIKAVHAAADTLRKIDIDDLQHIRSMLLRFEGLNTSSYILDVFDRVLQYEIESHEDVLEAAIRLDQMAEDPAPLMISNDRDTYAVLEQTLFVNPKRRAHATGAEWPISFGDILGPKPGAPVKPQGFFSGRADLVYFVTSPECDLIRKGGITTALLMAGSLVEIDMAKPGLAVTPKATPVVVLHEGQRFRVEWNFGELRAITLNSARTLLHEGNGNVAIVARLRKENALNLRQQLLSNMGRVGELAPLPRSMNFQAKLYFPLQQGGIQPIAMPEGAAITGNFLISRKAEYASAIFDSVLENDLTGILLDLQTHNLADKSQKAFLMLKEQARIRQIFRSGLQGIKLPFNGPREAGLLKIGTDQPVSENSKPKTDRVGTVINGDDIEGQLGNKLREAGLIVQMHLEEAS